ncbi:unnamed protein product [Protopolystoma xenopodis]|uniref:Uncharacterized protein n=1 Tax=Protopolystoma xenopodis TaxID=117903 RepID=A0A3S5A7R9_9PLAT|nr:unnamed protein product [Protopolystoma xenopodis]
MSEREHLLAWTGATFDQFSCLQTPQKSHFLPAETSTGAGRRRYPPPVPPGLQHLNVAPRRHRPMEITHQLGVDVHVCLVCAGVWIGMEESGRMGGWMNEQCFSAGWWVVEWSWVKWYSGCKGSSSSFPIPSTASSPPLNCPIADGIVSHPNWVCQSPNSVWSCAIATRMGIQLLPTPHVYLHPPIHTHTHKHADTHTYTCAQIKRHASRHEHFSIRRFVQLNGQTSIWPQLPCRGISAKCTSPCQGCASLKADRLAAEIGQKPRRRGVTEGVCTKRALLSFVRHVFIPFLSCLLTVSQLLRFFAKRSSVCVSLHVYVCMWAKARILGRGDEMTKGLRFTPARY